MDHGPGTGTAPAPAPAEGPGLRPPSPVPGAVRWVLALTVVVVTAVGWVVLSGPAPAPDDGRAATADHGPPALAFDLTGHPAPDATFPTFAGPPAHLADLRGSPVVLNLWASWCPPCVEELPAFEQVHRAYGDRVRFLGLAVNDTDAAARALAGRSKVSYQLGFDPGGRISTALGITTVPATVLIDRTGTVTHVAQGQALTAATLTDLVERDLHP